ncbi:MAG: cupin domain-containing protein [Solirubrobacterales bacterium]|nr:cupin domain-containing protein [Solirubrobacterales bacterium]
MPATQAVVVGPGQGMALRGPVGGPLLFKVRGEQTDGALTALENVIPPGTGPPLHAHDAQDEAWWVVSGAVRFQIGEELASAEAGSFVWVPRGVPHAFRNDDEAPATLLVLFTPAGIEPFFDAIAEADEVRGEDFARLGAAVGMTVLGPPLGPPAT